MTLTLPRLDDRSYDDLVAEARALIPSLYPQWTDHNPADPGITLIELFAWLAEMLIYRIDRLTDPQVRSFLRLLGGPDWQPGPDLEEDIRAAVATLRQRHRAVTAADYEALAMEASAGVARARCVPRRNLEAATEEARAAPAEGHVSVILVPDPDQAEAVDPASQPGAPLPSPALVEAVRDDLEPRRLLTTRHHVASPIYAPIGAEILVALQPDAPRDLVEPRVLEALHGFLDPLHGGPDGEGWPFGRDVYSSEVYELLDGVAGVDYVPEALLTSRCPEAAPSCLRAPPLINDDGELIGRSLVAHQLPWALLEPNQVIAAEAFVPVRLSFRVTLVAGASARAARTQVRIRVRRLFHPLYLGPDLQSAWQITETVIRGAGADAPEIATVDDLTVETVPGRLQGETLRLETGELAELVISVAID